jgi:hypothetical protein
MQFEGLNTYTKNINKLQKSADKLADNLKKELLNFIEKNKKIPIQVLVDIILRILKGSEVEFMKKFKESFLLDMIDTNEMTRH